MEKRCKTCGETIELSPAEQAWYERVGFAPADDCFTCNQKHHLVFRNSRALYHRPGTGSEHGFLSIYAPESPYKVFKTDVWYGDSWDASEYGRDFDFGQPFFEQLHALDLDVPRLTLNNVNADNSDYCNMTYGNRNCYLVFGGDFNEDTMYGTLCMHNRSCLEIDFSNDCELCSEISNSVGCYACRYAFDCRNCSECSFVSDCTGCNHCILCTNLSQKSYCIRNKQLRKEEFEREATALLNGTYSAEEQCHAEFLAFLQRRTVKAMHLIGCLGCTGDYQQYSKNCINSFDIYQSEDLCNVIYASKSKDSFQSSLLGDDSELCYEVISTVGAKECRFSNFIIDSWNAQYSVFCFNCQNIFGCAGLRHKQYCIFNKQYSKEEYETLVSKIIGHMKKTGEWGRFFPKDHSPFAYNETSAAEYFPITKEEALAHGFRWRERKEEGAEDLKSIPAADLPDDIKDITDEILKSAIASEATGRLFRITKPELAFYRRMNIPVPRKFPDERYRLRKLRRNPRRLWKRICAKCSAPIETTYAPDRKETVYCEHCYLKEVY